MGIRTYKGIPIPSGATALGFSSRVSVGAENTFYTNGAVVQLQNSTTGEVLTLVRPQNLASTVNTAKSKLNIPAGYNQLNLTFFGNTGTDSDYISIEFGSGLTFDPNYLIPDAQLNVNSERPIQNKAVANLLEPISWLWSNEFRLHGKSVELYQYAPLSEYYVGLGYIGGSTGNYVSSGTLRAYQGIPIPKWGKFLKVKGRVTHGSIVNGAGIQLQNSTTGEVRNIVRILSTTDVTEGVFEIPDGFDRINATYYGDYLTTPWNGTSGLWVEVWEKFDLTGDAIKDKLRKGQSFEIEKFPKLKTVGVVDLGSGFSSYYFPIIIDASLYFENPLGKYYLYYSTDHAGVAVKDQGAIGMRYSNDLINWTFYDKVVKQSTTPPFSGESRIMEIETPSIVRDDVNKRMLMYVHVANFQTSNNYSQESHILSSTDGLTWTWVKRMFDVPRHKVRGDGHNGYAIVRKLGGLYLASQVWGGTDNSFGAIAWSLDGLRWFPTQVDNESRAQFSDLSFRGVPAELSTADVVSTGGSGGVASTVKSSALRFISDVGEQFPHALTIIGDLEYMGQVVQVTSSTTVTLDGELFICRVYHKNRIIIKKAN